MTFSQMRGVIQEVLGRTYLLYAVIGLLFFLIMDRPLLEAKVLNQMHMPIDYLVLLAEGRAEADSVRLRDYLVFYRQVYKTYPLNPDINALMGFTYYYLGQTEKAAACYTRAAQRAPKMFWHHYNLGLIAYRGGDYETAGRHFQEAVNSDLTVTLKFEVHSWVYRQFDDPVKDTDGLPPVYTPDILSRQEEGLNAAYVRAYQLIVLCFYRQANYPAMAAAAQIPASFRIGDPSMWDFYLGLAAYHHGKFSPAVDLFQQSLFLNPRRVLTTRYLKKVIEAQASGAAVPPPQVDPEVLEMDLTPDDLRLKVF